MHDLASSALRVEHNYAKWKRIRVVIAGGLFDCVSWRVGADKLSGNAIQRASAPLAAACRDAQGLNEQGDCVNILRLARERLLLMTVADATNHPEATARLLWHAANALRQIGRYRDAESLLHSARALAASEMLDADVHYWRAQRAMLVQDWPTAAAAAEKAIRVHPDASPMAFHCLALAQQMQGDHEQAMDTWMLELHGMPLERAQRYLDSSMCFWKPMRWKDIDALYAALCSLCRPLTQSNSVNLERILRERVKLETLYPERFSPHNVASVLSSAIDWPSDLAGSDGSWCAVSNPVYVVDYGILRFDASEQPLNAALLRCAKAATPSELDRARKMLDRIIDDCVHATDRTVRVEGWSVAAVANALRCSIENTCSTSTPATRRRALRAARHVLQTAVSAKECGSLERLFHVHAWLFSRALQRNEVSGMNDAVDSMRTFVPQSTALHALHVARAIAGESNLASAVALMHTHVQQPVGAVLSADVWLGVARMYDQLAAQSAHETAQLWRRKKQALLIAALQRCTHYGTVRLEPHGSARPARLAQEPLYAALLARMKADDLEDDQQRQLAACFEWFGATIPAIDGQAQLIRDICRARVTYAVAERRMPLHLRIVRDTAAWCTQAVPYVWCSIHVSLRRMQESGHPRYWFADYTAPVQMRRITYAFAKAAGAIPPSATNTLWRADNTAHSITVINSV